LLGRWIGHFPRGRFLHERIASAEPVVGEGLLGWFAHYAIGVTFALLLLAIWGVEWVRSPTILPALLVGIGTIVAPWFVMQPAMGAGIAGSRTPNPMACTASVSSSQLRRCRCSLAAGGRCDRSVAGLQSQYGEPALGPPTVEELVRSTARRQGLPAPFAP
jgi:hypothetical protein